jgi:acyl-CoA synthetase (AMP-forming)/AMP-acid ligase II
VVAVAALPGLFDAPARPGTGRTHHDLRRLDAGGNLAIVGRADDAYIRGGYNICPSEVEAALAAS